MAHVYVRSGAAGSGTGANWANAFTTLEAAFNAGAAGDQFWVAADHLEESTELLLLSPGTIASPCTVRCVNHAGSVPPVSANLTTGAIVASDNNMYMQDGYVDCDGIEFKAGGPVAVGSVRGILFGYGGGAVVHWRLGPNSRLTLRGTDPQTGTKEMIASGGYASPNYNIFDGVIVKFSLPTQAIQVSAGRFYWRGGSVDPTGAIPDNLIWSINGSTTALIEGVDLSAFGSGKNLVNSAFGDFVFKDCKINPAVTFTAPLTTRSTRVIFSRVAADGSTYADRQYLYGGSEIATTSVIRTVPSSLQIVTTANAKYLTPYRALPRVIYNEITGSNRTVTLYGIANMSAMPKNDEVWNDVEYLGSAASPLGSFKTNGKADLLATGSALVADTSTWTALARANSAAYAVGVALNISGRVFFCTTAGTTAASAPAGYASAVDGGSVTDGTAVFRAGWRFKIATTLTSPQPGLAGLIYVYPFVGAASATIYLDRKLDIV